MHYTWEFLLFTVVIIALYSLSLRMKDYSLSRDPVSLDIMRAIEPAVKKMTSRRTSRFLASWLNIEAEYLVIVDHDKINNPILPLCT